MPEDALTQLSAAIAARVSAATKLLAVIDAGQRRPRAGIVWRAGVVVTSEQALPKGDSFPLSIGGAPPVAAQLAGRDAGTNVAVLRFDAAATPTELIKASLPQPGTLALVLGADRVASPSARMALVRSTGPEWFSMAGGRIDHLLRLDLRLAGDEDGGPVLDATGGLLGMATSGPRGQALVIPHHTIERVLEPLLTSGSVPRAWLGLGLQPVAIPEALRDGAGQARGLMVVSLATDGPGAQAGMLPGDILLTVDGVQAGRPNGLAPVLTADRIGQVLDAQILRAGAKLVLPVRLAERPKT